MAGGVADIAPTTSLVEILVAIGAGQMVAHYQPIISLTTGNIIGLEALARWDRPGAPLLAPHHFVPRLEGARRATDLSSWMLEQVCVDLADWRGRHLLPAGFMVAVNVSASELADRRLIRLVEEASRLAEILPAALCLEITETAPLDRMDVAAEVVGELGRMGVRVALDDYGVGYLGEAEFARLPVHFLKIPRPTMVEVGSDAALAASVAATVAGARRRGVQVVAEGLETVDQVELARRIGCDHGQGFGLGRPGPGRQVLSALAPQPAARLAAVGRLHGRRGGSSGQRGDSGRTTHLQFALRDGRRPGEQRVRPPRVGVA